MELGEQKLWIKNGIRLIDELRTFKDVMQISDSNATKYWKLRKKRQENLNYKTNSRGYSITDYKKNKIKYRNQNSIESRKTI